jgi:hypothetical protein
MILALISLSIVLIIAVCEIYQSRGFDAPEAIWRSFVAVFMHGLFYAGMLSSAWEKLGFWILEKML